MTEVDHILAGLHHRLKLGVHHRPCQRDVLDAEVQQAHRPLCREQVRLVGAPSLVGELLQAGTIPQRDERELDLQVHVVVVGPAIVRYP